MGAKALEGMERMDGIEKEIAELTAEKTSEGVTLRIPEGQKILRAGFKAINMQGLRDRFACDKVQAGLDLAACKEVIALKHHNPETAVIRRTNFWYNIGSMMVDYDYYKPAFSFFGIRKLIKAGNRVEFADRKLKVCSVRIEPVDKYIADKIPDRCLESMQKAIAAGLKWESFRVAYPVIETSPMKDPIILSIVGPEHQMPNDIVYIEIDMWE